MRLRIAVPILTTSASIMLAGLAIGHAQEQQQQPGQPRVHVRPPQAREAIKLRPAGRKRAGGVRRPGRRRGAPAAEAAGSESAGGTGLTPFETGIDYQPTSPRALVTFNLEDADLPDLVRLISNITGKRFILPGKVRSIKATVYAPTKVRVSEAYNAFLSILEVNGMTLVPAGRYLKIVESTNIENQPISTYTGDTPTAITDRFITRLHPIQNVSAEDVATLLTRFKSAQGNVTAYAPTNTLIITDTGAQIRRMLRLVEVIDIPRTGEQIWVEPVHYATASDLAERLIEIFPPTDAAGGSAASTPRRRPTPPRATKRGGSAAPTSTTVGSSMSGAHVTSILADERTNSLILVATEGAYLRILEMVRQLDVPVEGEGSVHVYYVQHGDAEEIASTLESLLGGSTGRAGSPAGARKRGAAARPAAAGAVASGALFEGEIRVTAHEPSNALVITSSLHDFAALRSVLAELDAPRRQVYIEAVIMELSVTRSNQLGFSYHGGVGDFPHTGALTVLGFNAQGSLSPINQDSLTGLALGIRGQNIPNSQQLSGLGLSIPAFGVVINAIADSGDANILSTPHLIAMDNVEAEISVGENVPLQTSGIASGVGGLAGLAGGLGGAAGGGAAGLAGLAGLAGGFGGAVPRQDVGTTIRITPHINDADELRLELEEEISSRGATEGTLGVVSINRRTAKTQLVVRDQQTVVIGGLMRDSVVTSETKVPILGDIPLLGVLFRRTTRNTKKTNLLLFLTPYIIRSAGDLRAIFERKMRERQEFIDRYFVFRGDEYEPAVDYSRTRGLVAEINNELDELAHEHTLLEAARGTPPPEHHARPPVGAATPRGPAEGDTVISPAARHPGQPVPSPTPQTTLNQGVSTQPVQLQLRE